MNKKDSKESETKMTQLRQLLTEVREMIKCPHGENVNSCDFCKRTRLLDQVLALLPCPTCNGTKQIPIPQSIGFGTENEIMDTCPDCQKTCKRCGGINGHKQVDDPQAGNSHMLTKMQCPFDKRK